MNEKQPTCTLRGKALVDAYLALMSIQLGGKIWAHREGRKIVLRGEGLPMHPQHPHFRKEGWSLLGYNTPAQCREYVANRGCMGQWHAYEPGQSVLSH